MLTVNVKLIEHGDTKETVRQAVFVREMLEIR